MAQRYHADVYFSNINVDSLMIITYQIMPMWVSLMFILYNIEIYQLIQLYFIPMWVSLILSSNVGSLMIITYYIILRQCGFL